MATWPTARITHIGLNVTDLARSVDFYTNAMGMKVMKSADGRFATVSFGYQHHDIALIPVPPQSGTPSPVGMNHFAVEVRNYADLAQRARRLHDAGVPLERAIDHRTGMGLYLKDPDGNAIELWCENYSTMERAIAFGVEMTEEFEENHIGYPIDMAQLLRDHELMAGEPAAQSDEECLA